MARNRIIYASQSVWADGEVLHRVQSFGASSTFTSEDVMELGHLDIVDVVDDVPAVALTLNTNDFGDVRTLATIAQISPVKKEMNTTADNDNANLVVVSGTNQVKTNTFLHGVALADFAVVCGNLPGLTFWAPVQDECSVGTLDNNIDQTLFLDSCYFTSVEFAYSTGANATENYSGETDNKTWLINEGRFVNYDKFDVSANPDSVVLTLDVANDVAELSSGIGFLRKSKDGQPAVTVYDASKNEKYNHAVEAGTVAKAGVFVFNNTDNTLFKPTDTTFEAGDEVEVIYSANAYGAGSSNTYFTALSDLDRPDMIGAVRQGQVEIYIVSADDTEFKNAWRLTSCTISADLTREPLAELGHLAPYDRTLTLPIPITVSVDTTAGDLENWARMADKLAEYSAESIYDLDLGDLMASEDLRVVVKIFAQTDEEAGGTGLNRKVAPGSPLIGHSYFVDGVKGTYAEGDREYALKTVVVEHLKMTDEAAQLDMGANMTQSFGFRSTNDLFVVKGDLSVGHITGDFKIRRNA